MTAPRAEHLGPDELRSALRAAADGSLPDMAAVELLIAHRYWLRRPDFLDRVDVSADGVFAVPRWGLLGAVLDSGEGLYGTSSERGVLAVACSIASRYRVDLGHVLLSCDRTNVQRIADAVLTVGGVR